MERQRLIERILELKEKRKAIILAHNYQPPEIQDIADLRGDSLELSLKASKTDAEVIVFCGVYFMAETAKIVSPKKKVLLPVGSACCEMADMITPEDVLRLKEAYPDAPVVTYVNSTAEVKALSDVCCTSANAVKVVGTFKEKQIIMLPDMNLARYTQRFYPDKKIIYFEGFCPFHHLLTPEEVLEAKKAHPEALFIAHPECRPEVIDLADRVASTSGMLRLAKELPNQEFIIGTEVGLLYPLSQQNPDKKFYHPAPEKMVCPSMKKITLENLLSSLENLEFEVVVEEEIRVKAYNAVKKMLEIV
ncbi:MULTISPECIES: quinolinate synthase NadA [Thermodesulfobacterium]|jgi:quinolinate synthase|uniref:Quinolinate synthase n=2 Tax=Thermodesulfobacterium commune TaxID=1741 RepID=A0A075WSK8_9BACT|nr:MULTISPECIES: quinolinate synthase NadA [Thermodesulfobacterium]KUJ97490.1 MAG: Quinolinate synthase A [Thermodesulfobacterium sp. 37_54]KUK19239.1 MAG: Quinolinate synthase A [Thermodesulfobacterium commune]AIH03393.1 quinolinate synthetase [Thermodesulfobacterium commune DSM 2178]KUK38595.1 MAG: Quinolinate synthase A [Thermodesulfobacterium commune]MBZ4681154.1 quinolinate synthetase [Thermodesulfobacterium sp.]